MTRDEVKAWVKRNYDIDVDKSDWYAIVKIRHHCDILPDYAMDGTPQAECEWALLDMLRKQDTGEYGEITYIHENERDIPEPDWDTILNGEPF